MIKTYEQIIKEIEQGIFEQIYFLMGEETFFIDSITNLIAKKALPESQKSFNYIVFFGRDTNVRDIIHTARRFPMMAERMVVIVKEAQELKRIEELIHYIKRPQPSTVLVINYKYRVLDKRSSLYKLLRDTKNNVVVFEAKKLYENKIPQWINNYLKQKNLFIDIVAAQLLVEDLGTDLSKISNELDKLSIILPQGSKITTEIIEKNVGISKDYNNFELQKAIGLRDFTRVFKIVNYFANNQKEHHIQAVISSLYYYFVRLMKVHFAPRKDKNSLAQFIGVHPFFVEEYYKAANNFSPQKIVKVINVLKVYDLRSKGVNNVSTGSGELLKEMVFKILHV